MQEDIREALGEEETCPYLESRRAQMRYRLIERCDVEAYQRMLERGWRRFGRLFFRPACRDCGECRSLRVDVESFEISRSRRRTIRANRDLQVILQPPSVSESHLRLYNRYHLDMSERRGWREKSIGAYEYYLTFVEGEHEFARELLFWEGGHLVAVALVDVLPRSLSAVYCFYDPDRRPRALGVYSVLQQIALARRLRIPHVYLGYWVAENESMRYKAGYRPHQLLEGRPEAAESAVWREVEAENAP